MIFFPIFPVKQKVINKEQISVCVIHNNNNIYKLPSFFKIKDTINYDFLSYSIYNPVSVNFNISDTLIHIKDTFINKIIYLKKNFSTIPDYYVNYFFNKKFLHFLPSNQSNISSTQIFSIFPKNILIKPNIISMFQFYLYWSKIFNKSIKNIFLVKDSNSNIKQEKIKDITFGLLNIENLLEAKLSQETYTIKNVNIILQSNTFYDSYLPNKKYCLSLFSISKNKNYLLITDNNLTIYTKESYIISPTTNILSSSSLNEILIALYNQKLNFFNNILSCKSSHFFIYNTIVESLLKQYLKYGIIIPSFYFELLALKLTAFVKINYPANNTFYVNEIIESSKAHIIQKTMKILNYQQIIYTPIIVGITKSVSVHANALSSLSFQALFKYLTKIGLENTIDWLTDIKSNILTSHILKSGSGWYRHYIKV